MSYIFIDMNMSRKLILRITEQQFKNLSKSLSFERDGERPITKSSLIRGILNEYFDKNCRKVEMEKKSKNHKGNMDSKYSTRNNLKSNNKK
jgi:predicted AAA+ superfamily ATPase